MTMEWTTPGDFSLLSVRGADARKFLQGQLSCHMDELTPQHSLPGAYCNLKGRVIADFVVIDNTDQLLLRCAPGMAGLVRDRLSKYAVFFQVELDDVSSDWQRIGLIGDTAVQAFARQYGTEAPEETWDTLHTDRLIAMRMPGMTPRLEMLAPIDLDLAASCRDTNEANWRLEDIRAGIIHVNEARSEQYTPQVLNYDLDGTINFRKGCYTGQEIVARMHYRGKARRRLYRVVAEYPAGFTPEAVNSLQVSCRGTDNTDHGEILEQEACGDRLEILAILSDRLAEAAPDTLCLSDPVDGSIKAAIDSIQRFD